MPSTYDNSLDPADSVSDDQREAYEDFRDSRSNADTFDAMNEWLDQPNKWSDLHFAYRDAFEAYDFDRWLASGAWERHIAPPCPGDMA